MGNMSVLIKPASGSCNLKCRYCFYLDEMNNRQEQNYGMMSFETLKNIIEKTIKVSDNEATFSFQGGEPTLRGLPFFQEVIRLEKKHNPRNIKINNSIQINGVDLSDEFLDFFKKNNFLVGISLDGTKHTHDKERIDSYGNPTYDRVILTIEKLRKKGIMYNVLTVVNGRTAKIPNRIYEFYKKMQIRYMQFIPCIPPINDFKKVNSFTLNKADYATFLISLFDLWYKDYKAGNYVSIPQFESYVMLLSGQIPLVCGFSGVCSLQTVIEANGDVFPCDFYVLDGYKLGNINQDDFTIVDEVRKQKGFVEKSITLKAKCYKCKFLNLCRGGCRRYREPLDKENINIFCQAYEIFFKHSFEKLIEIANELNNAKTGLK